MNVFLIGWLDLLCADIYLVLVYNIQNINEKSFFLKFFYISHLSGGLFIISGWIYLLSEKLLLLSIELSSHWWNIPSQLWPIFLLQVLDISSQRWAISLLYILDGELYLLSEVIYILNGWIYFLITWLYLQLWTLQQYIFFLFFLVVWFYLYFYLKVRIIHWPQRKWPWLQLKLEVGMNHYIIPNNGIPKSTSSVFPQSEGFITQYTP